MEKRLTGTVIKVKDLDKCRHFYRDVLALGAPAIDSNIWVEFRLNFGGIVALQQVETLEELPYSQRMRWALIAENLSAVLVRLQENGYAVRDEKVDALGFQLHETSDPEGNPILLYPMPQLPEEPII